MNPILTVRSLLPSFLLFLFIPSFGQQQNVADTLETVIVNAYDHNARLMSVAAPVQVIGKRELRSGNEISLVNALTTLPGVNMEERSPGSYRINIRGSSQRAPFGVRNVKVYYQGIPITDPGGNTYLQILSPYDASSIEVIKGPSGSLYGTGTGGVLLIRDVPSQSGIQISGIYGSKNSQNLLVSGNRVGENGGMNIKFSRQSSDGYRDHTAMHRNVLALNGTLKASDKWSLDAHFLYGELYYQTPGALTLPEFKKNPMDARPHAGSNPSADEAQAAFYVNYLLAGFHFQQKISERWNNEVIVYGAYGQNRNPNFRNYSRTSEPHGGARVNFHYGNKSRAIHFAVDLGGEFQSGWNGQRVYKNNSGITGSLQTDDEVKSKQAFVYGQGKLSLGEEWSLTAGSSLNFMSVDFQRFSGTPYSHHRNFNGLWMPRIALSKTIRKTSMLYAAVSRGFSPPSTSELLPSTDVFDTHLQAERGTNYELGWRMQALANRLFVDVSIFHFSMKESIIQKRDSTGGDYFINAGSTTQNGLEVLARYLALAKPGKVFSQIYLSFSATIHDFRFKDYKPLDKDYSGNKLPGTEPIKLSANAEIACRNGLSLDISSMYFGRVALNDANVDFADPYITLNLRLGYTFRKVGSNEVSVFAGASNLTNTIYSLGNDINAFGGRYYNAAPGRMFFAGVSMKLFQPKTK